MKRLFFIVLLFIGVVQGAAGATNAALFYWRDFQLNPQQVKQSFIYFLGAPGISGTNIVQSDRITKSSTTNGFIGITNFVAGSYRLEHQGSQSKTTNYFIFPDTNGVISAADWIVNAVSVSTPANSPFVLNYNGNATNLTLRGTIDVWTNLNLKNDARLKFDGFYMSNNYTDGGLTFYDAGDGGVGGFKDGKWYGDGSQLSNVVAGAVSNVNIEAGANITVVTNSASFWTISASGTGGSGVNPNANQLTTNGAGTVLNIKSGSLQTNNFFYGTLTISDANSNNFIYYSNNLQTVEAANTNLIYVTGATSPSGANGTYSNSRPGSASQGMAWTNTVGVFGIVFDPNLNVFNNEWSLTNVSGTTLYDFALSLEPNGTWTARNGSTGSPIVHYGTNFSTNYFPDTVIATNAPLLWESTNTIAWVDSVAGNDLTFRKGRRGLPAKTVNRAVNYATNSGDTVMILPGTYTLASNVLMAIGTRIVAPGPLITKVIGTSSGYGITLADNVVVKGFTIDHSAMTGNTYGFPINGNANGCTNFLVEDMDIIGYSDSFYFIAGRFTGVVNRTRIVSQWDAYFDSSISAANTDTIEFNNCAWVIINTNNNWGVAFSKPTGIRAGKNKVVFNTGTIQVTSSYTNVACVDALQATGIIELNNTMLIPSGFVNGSWAITNGSGASVTWRGGTLNATNISGTVAIPNSGLFVHPLSASTVLATDGSKYVTNAIFSQVNALAPGTILTNGHSIAAGFAAKVSLTNGLIIRSNTFPISSYSELGNSGCVFWMSNATMYLVCTNSIGGTVTVNKLGGL